MLSLATWLFLAQAVAAPQLPATYEQLSARVAASYDTSRGGFVTKAGVPVESAVELAFLRARETGDRTWRERAVATTVWTRSLLDTLSGGYFHGGDATASDQGAMSKRADANARRLEMLLRAAEQSGESKFLDDAANVANFFDRVLLDGRGGFVSQQVGDRELEPATNGVAIHAWMSWAAHRLDRRMRDFGLLSIDRVWETCWTPEVGLVRKSFGEVMSHPLLADQVEMGRACLLAARSCGREAELARARQLGDLVLARFEDSQRGGFRTSLALNQKGVVRKTRMIPKENARAALFLAELAATTGEARYRDAALRAVAAFEAQFPKLGLDAADWALAVRMIHRPVLASAVEWPKAASGDAPRRKKSMTVKLGHH